MFSLESQCVMEFKKENENETKLKVLLDPKSLLILSGNLKNSSIVT